MRKYLENLQHLKKIIQNEQFISIILRLDRRAPSARLGSKQNFGKTKNSSVAFEVLEATPIFFN